MPAFKDLTFLIPVLNGLFGWMVIEILISFIFRPYEKKNFLSLKVHGLIPSLQESFADDLGAYISENLVNFKELEDKLVSPESLASFHDFMDKKAEHFLRVKLTEKLPILSMFITDSLINTAKEALVGELGKLIPEVIKMYSGKIQQEFDVQKKVADFIKLYPTQEIEKKFYEVAGKRILQLKFFVAILGILIGVFEIGVLIVR